jgi:CubicO group peptidase (beta-lactamase class C family)
MGFIKQSLIFCFLLVLFTYFKSFLDPKLPLVFGGYYHPAFKNVADKFKENLKNGKERGGAFAVYHKGRLVVDIWGGYADEEAQIPWQRDTMSIGFSNTKGIAALMVAQMADKGVIDYKALVSDYWPEFAESDKGNITVEMLISHQAGLAALDDPINILDINGDPEKVEKSLCSQRPLWPAGSAHGYHTLTYGLYIDTLMKKVDPKGRTADVIFMEDISSLFDVEMYMAVPRQEFYRVARVYEDPVWKFLYKCLSSPRYIPLFFRYILNSNSLVARAGKAVKEFSLGSNIHNNPYYREMPLSCCYGTGTARGFSKLYGIISNGGINGTKRFLSEKAINKLTTPIVSGLDETIGMQVTYGPGTLMKTNPRGDPMFGHTGHGGQVAMADMKNNLGIAYLTNFISLHGLGDDPRYVDLENELYKSLDKYVAQQG